tara:strand:- start:270 stop:647 length:378 start_codon:yes stop_codon:yes gene_type:complete
MGNICLKNNNVSKRDSALYDLYKLYNNGGGFNIGKSEIIALAKFLHDKEVMRINEQICLLTMQLGRLDDSPPQHYMKSLLNNKTQISFSQFKKIMNNVLTPEINNLIMDAKVIEYERDQREAYFV